VTTPGSSAPIYYHGGIPGLAPGDYVQSLTAADAFNVQAVLSEEAKAGLAPSGFADLSHYDGSVVYLTTRRDVAAAYATTYIGPNGVPTPGDVYRVEPDGELGIDPDYAHVPDICMTAPRARVVKVERRRARLSPYQTCQATGPYMTWDDESPIYDDQGFILPSPQMREQGKTALQCRAFGRWKHLEEVGYTST
jgi:hypothetical protein